MGFESLLGNYQLKENLSRSLSGGHISHFYLISGPEGSGKHTLARLLAAAILCQEKNRPCLHCHPCRKVMGDTHPDFITVSDPEHKTVPVKLVRQYRDDMFVRPNESNHKVYLFPQELGVEGQNALLKILEEPPAYGVFILLTENPEQLLPTVRSRCTPLKLQPLPRAELTNALSGAFPTATSEDIEAAAERSGGFLGQASALLEQGTALSANTERFLQAFAASDALELTLILAPMEKWKRDQLIPVLQQWLYLVESALACRSGMAAVSAHVRQLAAQRSPADLMNAALALQKGIDYAQRNISPAAVCGWLSWALR